MLRPRCIRGGFNCISLYLSLLSVSDFYMCYLFTDLIEVHGWNSLVQWPNNEHLYLLFRYQKNYPFAFQHNNFFVQKPCILVQTGWWRIISRYHLTWSSYKRYENLRNRRREEKDNNELSCSYECQFLFLSRPFYILYPSWIKWFALVAITPFRRQIRIRLAVVLLVQFLAQVAKGVTTPVL